MTKRSFCTSYYAAPVILSLLAIGTRTEAFAHFNAISPTLLHDSSTSLYSSIPRSKKKNKKNRSNRRQSPGRALSVNELSEHVSDNYIRGANGPLSGKVVKRGIFDNDQDASQTEFLKKLNGCPVLVLNADYQPLSYLPLSLWSWQVAVKAVFSGKVQVVDVYPDVTIRAASLEVPLPSVIALTEYVNQVNKPPAFTRRNVFLRDEYKCQYCKEHFHTADLSLDHVIPRCMGGQLNWENAVTCCKKCNGKKGSLKLSELRSVGMKLMREPRVPTKMELAAKAAKMVPRRVHPTWKPYIGLASTPSRSGSYSSKEGDEQFIDDRYFEESDF